MPLSFIHVKCAALFCQMSWRSRLQNMLQLRRKNRKFRKVSAKNFQTSCFIYYSYKAHQHLNRERVKVEEKILQLQEEKALIDRHLDIQRNKLEQVLARFILLNDVYYFLWLFSWTSKSMKLLNERFCLKTQLMD